LINLLRAQGVTSLSGTPQPGDQGADILFTYFETKIAVQAKRYSDTVGNKAVQEVYAAKSFYKCDDAWVITSSRFSTSAENLAAQLKITLIDGKELERFPAFFQNYFSKRYKASG
ncbi:MAG: restriction endonuclease, partial [Bdellovibrionota bacterium]